MSENTEQKLPTDTGPDLELLRDNRVVPVAQGVLDDISKSMPSTDITPDTDFTTLLIQILQRTLDADLNLTTDNPYLFQLVLGVFAAFNTVTQKSKLTANDDSRFARIAGELMAIMVKANVPMGKDVKPAEQEKALEAYQGEFDAIFEREKLTSLELSYILEGMLRSFKTTEQLFSGNVQRSVQVMEAKILQIPDMTDLSMKTLDETLKGQIKELNK